MAKKSKKRRSSVKRKAKKKSFGWFKKTLLVFFVAATFLLVTYLGYLDYTVRHQFEGKRWAIPARVYASPLELYAGFNITPSNFEDVLQELNYRPDYQLASEGTYYKKGQQVHMRTRDFTFWDQEQQGSRVRVDFSGQTIAQIIDLDLSEQKAILRMDPLQIGSFYPSRKEDRVLIKLENTPDYLIHGLLATEDRDFYHHYGISFRAIARAMWANIKAMGIVQGGSTITQQLVKNFYLTPERSLWRKLNEAFMALILEARYSKDEIFETYLNEVYLGQDGARSIHGFGLASEFYFDKPLEELKLHQVATLVALVRGPSYYDPRRNPERAINRRNMVIDEMQKQGYITKKQAKKEISQELEVIPHPHRSVNRYPAFMELVRRQLSQEYRDEDLTSEGLRVFTTLEPEIQDTLERTVREKLKQLEKRPKVNDLQTAAIVTRRDNGEIVAMTGGRDGKDAGFNRALDALRPIGSLVKPAVYLTALEYPGKYSITTKVSDRSIRVKAQKGKYWSPKNYDNKEHGEVELHKALAHSYNLATVRIGMDVGIGRTAKTMRSLGVNRPLDLFPSLLLGASPLTPLEVTQMYQTLAGDGFSTPLRAIRAVISSEGEPLQRYPFTLRQAVDPGATYITNTILQEAVRQGTGRSAYQQVGADFNLVGKTGTTNEMRDSWFAGYSGDYLSVVWVGRDDNKSTGLTGASGALQIWASLMKKISTTPVTLIPPDNVERVWIDPETGLRANESCSGAVLYPYISGSAPDRTAPCVDTPVNKVKTWFNDLVEQF